MRKNFPRRAFSMIEISVSLAIIAIIMMGIIKGQTLYLKARLATAQTLTQNSVVKDIADLMVWYETSMESSFLFSEEKNGSTISVWYDNSSNPQKTNATQSTSDYKPIFYENIFNGSIPAIRFDGIDDYLSTDLSLLVGASYTVFVVEQRRSSASSMMFIAGSANSSSPTNIQLGYASNTSITQAHSNTAALTSTYTVSSYSSATPTIHTFWFSTSGGQKYWANGGSSTDADKSSMTTAITSYASSSIGRYASSNFFNGDIAEIIIFKRALQTQERQMVETYLSQKYQITIS